MKLFLKRFLPLLLSLCLLAGTAFAGCQDTDNPDDTGNGDITDTPTENPAQNGYTFTVLFPDGTNVNGAADSGGLGDVCVQLMDGTTYVKLVNGPDYAPVGTNGVAKFKCTPGEYTITLANAPTGYHLGDFKTDTEHENYTVTLSYNEIVYTADVINTDGSAAANASVTLTDGKDITHTVTTDANGKAVFPKLQCGTYSVSASATDCTAKIHTTSPKDATEKLTNATLNITLIHYTKFSLSDGSKLTEEQSGKMLRHYTDYIFNADVNSYYFTAQFGDDEIALYAFMPEYTANYSLLVYAEDRNEDTGYNIDFYNGSYNDTIESNLSDGNGTGMFRIGCTAGVPYFFACSKTDGTAGQFSFVISEPDFSNEKFLTTEPGTYQQTYRASSQLLSFKPSVSGVYTITTVSDYDTYAELLGNANNVLETYTDGGAGSNFLAEIEIQDSYVGNDYLFRIYLKNTDGTSVTLPANFAIVITRTKDARPDTSHIVENVAATATAKCEEVGGTFTFLPLDGTVRPVKGSDGNWYVTVNGSQKKVYVALSKSLSERTDYLGETGAMSFANLEYLGTSSGDDPNANTDEKKNSNLTVYDDILKTGKRLNYSSFIEYYTGYSEGKYVAGSGICNSDGVYALNEELELFLTRFFAYAYNQEKDTPVYFAAGLNMLGMFTDSADGAKAILNRGCGWLLPCGYYA